MNWPESIAYARACSKADRVYEAVKAYEHLRSLSRTDSDLREVDGYIYQVYVDRKDYVHMAQLMMEAQDPSPDGHWGRQVLWSVHSDMARPLSDALSDALKGGGNHPISQIQLAGMYRDLRDYDRWRSIIKKVAADYPEDPYVLGFVMEACMYDRETWQFGIEVGRIAVKLPAVSWQIWLNYAMLCDYAHLEDEAVDAARTLLKGWPNDYTATANSVNIFRHYSRWDDAIDAAKKAITASPGGSDLSELELARTYSAAGRYSDAIQICQKLLAESKIGNVKSQCNTLLASMAVKDSAHSTDEGIRALVEAFKTGNEWPIGSVLFSILSDQASKEGLQTMLHGLQSLPAADRVSPLYNAVTGGLSDYLGGQADAKRLLTAPVISKLRNSDILYDIYQICVRTKDGALALDVCKRMVELKPNEYRSYESLAGAYILAGQKDEASATARSYAKKFSNDPEAIWSAGDILAWTAKPSESETMLNRAVKKADELAALGKPVNRNTREDVWLSLAELYKRSGQKEKEIDCLRNLRKLPSQEINYPYQDRRLHELGVTQTVVPGS